MADNPFDQFDATPAAAPSQAPASNPFDQFDNKPVPPPTQEQQPAQEAAPAAKPQAAAQPNADHIAHIRGMLDSNHDNATVKAAIMDYATKNNLVGEHFESDIDSALSYRSRAGNHRAATDTSFAADAGTPEEVTVTAHKPKADPNMTGFDAGLIGARESIPGADRIKAGVDATADFLRGDGFDYGDHLQHNRDLADQAWDDHAGAYGTGMGVGLGAQMLIPGAGEASLARSAGMALQTLRSTASATHVRTCPLRKAGRKLANRLQSTRPWRHAWHCDARTYVACIDARLWRGRP
jgi:hypothetical protein